MNVKIMDRVLTVQVIKSFSHVFPSIISPRNMQRDKLHNYTTSFFFGEKVFSTISQNQESSTLQLCLLMD